MNEPRTSEGGKRHLHPLWYVCQFFWSLPTPLWVVGNWVSDLRFRLYTRYGWEWI